MQGKIIKHDLETIEEEISNLENEESERLAMLEHRRNTIIEVFKRNHFREPTEEEIKEDLDFLHRAHQNLKSQHL